MHMHIHADGFELTAGLRAYAQGRFAFALDRARHLVNQVSIRLVAKTSNARCRSRCPTVATW